MGKAHSPFMALEIFVLLPPDQFLKAVLFVGIKLE
jgi:hypothetical protein